MPSLARAGPNDARVRIAACPVVALETYMFVYRVPFSLLSIGEPR